MNRIYQVDFHKQYDNDADQWERENMNVLATDAEAAIAKAKKHVLAEKGSYKDDENGKTVKWKITGFRLDGVALVVEADI